MAILNAAFINIALPVHITPANRFIIREDVQILIIPTMVKKRLPESLREVSLMLCYE